MNKQDVGRFIGRLKRLSGEIDPSKKDRAAMAVLRRGVSNPETDHKVLAVIGSWLSEVKDPREFKWYTLVACLYALNQHDLDDAGKSTIGAAARSLRTALPGAGAKSLDLQFSAILDGNRDDLPLYLRHLIHRLGSADPPIHLNYRRLLVDLISLDKGDDMERKVRRDWAFQYWNAYIEREVQTEESTTELQEEPS